MSSIIGQPGEPIIVGPGDIDTGLNAIAPQITFATIMQDEFAIDQPPLTTPIQTMQAQLAINSGLGIQGGNSGIVMFSANQMWAKWFNQVQSALHRVQVSITLTFANVAAGSDQQILVQFPQNTVLLGDFPVLSISPPPARCTIIPYIFAPDQVIIVFSNNSAGTITFTAQAVKLTIFRQAP